MKNQNAKVIILATQETAEESDIQVMIDIELNVLLLKARRSLIAKGMQNEANRLTSVLDSVNKDRILKGA